MDKLPTKPDITHRARYVANILRVYDAATPDQLSRGASWYYTAHELAGMLSPSVRQGAGLLAALSVQKSWPENTRLARRFLAGEPIGHMAGPTRAALRILAGEPSEEVLTGHKTSSFFRCIAEPGSRDAVVIDRHAHDVAAGEPYGSHDRGLSNATRYASLVVAYRYSAAQTPHSPSQVQAITWCVWRERFQLGQGRTKQVVSPSNGGE